MIRALLDVNALIALLDPNHVFHIRIHEWWRENKVGGWASCPLTENGVVRILSQPTYSVQMQFAPGVVTGLLAEFKARTDHQFWPDSLTLTDSGCFDLRYLAGHRQVTDTYLLALAVQHSGRLVTFDQGINLGAVKGALKGNLEVITG